MAATVGLPPAALAGGGRTARDARGREGAAYLWCRLARQSGRLLAAAFGVSPQAASAAASRGEPADTYWRPVWNKLH